MIEIRLPLDCAEDPQLCEAAAQAQVSPAAALGVWLSTLVAAARFGSAPDNYSFLIAVAYHADRPQAWVDRLIAAFREVGLLRGQRVADPERWFDSDVGRRSAAPPTAEG